MPVSANVVADSYGSRAPRLTTFFLRYPKIVHGEAKTHRVIRLNDCLVELLDEVGFMDDANLSRNASSSRAVPVRRNLEEVGSAALRAAPVFWGAEGRGMAALEEIDDVDRCVNWADVMADAANVHRLADELVTRRECARRLWELGAVTAARIARAQAAYAGAHKSIVNRQIEPYLHVSVVATATEPGWLNFFGLRLDRAAQPEIRALAEAAWVAWNGSNPRRLEPGQWHVPYADDRETDEDLAARYPVDELTGPPIWFSRFTCFATEVRVRVSTARCARTSYLSFATGRRSTIDEDVRLHDELMSRAPLHASPAEHQATPAGVGDPDRGGNLGPAWVQHRKLYAGEAVAPLPDGYAYRGINGEHHGDR